VVNQNPILTYPVPSTTRLFRNDSAQGNWIKIHLKGIEAETHGLGSKVEIVVGDTHMIREIDGGGSSHLSQNATYAHFGVGDATQIDEVIVRWTGGNTQVLKNIKVNQVLTVTEVKSLAWKMWLGYSLGGILILGLVCFFILKKKLECN
jgi:enediyne biosynthesis protein E4